MKPKRNITFTPMFMPFRLHHLLGVSIVVGYIDTIDDKDTTKDHPIVALVSDLDPSAKGWKLVRGDNICGNWTVLLACDDGNIMTGILSTKLIGGAEE